MFFVAGAHVGHSGICISWYLGDIFYLLGIFLGNFKLAAIHIVHSFIAIATCNNYQD